MSRTTIMGVAAAAMTLAFAFTTANAAEKAASPCKGLAEPVCKADTKCSWVKPRKSAKGKEVAGYCRAKPAKKAKAAPAAAPKS